MAEGITPTETDFELARRAVYFGVESLVMQFPEDVESFIESVGWTAYIEQEIKIRACNNAYIRMQAKALLGD